VLPVTGPQRRPRRRTALLAAGALALAVLIVAAVVAVRAVQGVRSDRRLESVAADADALADAVLVGYPYHLARTRLEQRGTTVTVVEAGTATETVELAEGNRVAEWVAPPFSRKGWPFVLCVASEQGEWAVYHSSDGVVRRKGAGGGCRMPDVPGVNARYPCPEPMFRVRHVDRGRAAVKVVWTFENANADLARWVDVYDGDRSVRRISPFEHVQRLATFPRDEGYDEELTFVATNGLARFDSVGCAAIPVVVPAA
jgi:hypothetical protein